MAHKARYTGKTRMLGGGFGVWDEQKNGWVNRHRYDTKAEADDAASVLETIRLRGGGRDPK